MSIKYELSLWYDYPAAVGLKERKADIVAATDMDYSGRAQDIILTRTYTGKDTLEFDLPVKYFDIMKGEEVQNPLLSKIVNKSKLKLWRDERWWNPFATYIGTGDDGCEKYEGAWTQGRWYDFIVNSKKEKRSKKKLMYHFKCDALFVNELSRNGYTLQFVPDTDIMSANGMGTAHDLAERIVEGTDWKYVKTEVFPDFEEQFNPHSGETIRVPKATDQIDWMGGLERYGYCYKCYVDNKANQDDILAFIEKELNIDEQAISRYAKFNDNYLMFSPKGDGNWKNYVLGYTKTNIITSYAEPILSQHSGSMVYKNIDGTDQKADGILFNNLGLWESDKGTSSELSYIDNIVGNEFEYKLKFKGRIKYIGYRNTALDAGDRYAIRVSCNKNITMTIKDAKDETDVISLDINSNSSTDVFEDTYWFIIPKRIEEPEFYFSCGEECEVNGIFIYNLVGATEEIDDTFDKVLGSKTALYGTLSGLSNDKASFPVNNPNFTTNTATLSNGTTTYIWLPCNTIAQNNFKNGLEVHLCEFNMGTAGYKQVYLPQTGVYTKITNYNIDKRRAISGEKSNRYSLLETIAKTFYCFTKFMVDHDEQGYIKTDSAGRPLKHFTFVSELGRNQFHGFTYEVNLNEVERSVDSDNLVTKCWVESIDNQYEETGSGMTTIQNSVYNDLGEVFVYNFEYYLHQGLLNKEEFLKDYREVIDYVGWRNIELNRMSEKYTPLVTARDNAQVALDTAYMLQTSLKDEANKILGLIGWSNFEIDQYAKSTTARPYFTENVTFPTIDYTKLPRYTTGDITYVDETKVIPYDFNSIETLARYIAIRPRADVDLGSVTDTSQLIGKGMPESEIEDNLIKIFSLQSSYNNQEANIAIQSQKLQNAKTELTTYETFRDKYTKEKQKKLEWFEKRYMRFIIEGQWKGEDYIDADTYYLDATRAVAASAMPKVSYSMNVLDLSKLCNPFNPEDTEWGKDFVYDVGDTTFVKDTELFPKINGKDIEQKAMVASLKSYVDKDKADDIELRNFETRFEELFQTIAAAVTNLQLNENIYGRAANFTAEGTIDTTILEKSFAQNKNLVISSANNQVTQDNRGITIKDLDNTGNILRAIAGGIFLSRDGGATYTAGITAEGMNASLITSGQIDTSKIVIRRTDVPQYCFDTQGLTAYGLDTTKIADDKYSAKHRFIRFDQFGLWMTEQGNLFPTDWWTRLEDNETPVGRIQDYSVFSLTEKGFKYTQGGLTLGSIGENTYGLSFVKNDIETVRLTSDGIAQIANWQIIPNWIQSVDIHNPPNSNEALNSHDGLALGIYDGDPMIISRQYKSWKVGDFINTFYVNGKTGELQINSSGKGTDDVDIHLSTKLVEKSLWGPIEQGYVTMQCYLSIGEAFGVGLLKNKEGAWKTGFYASFGKIGNWEITNGSIQSIATNGTAWSHTTLTGGGYEVSDFSKANVIKVETDKGLIFNVTKDGHLYAKDAYIEGNGTFTGDVYANNGYFKGDITGAKGTFSGTLEAKTGHIGGWNITDDYLDSYGVGLTRLFLSAGTSSDYWMGATDSSGKYKFILHKNGTLTVEDAVIQGTLQAGSYISKNTTLGDNSWKIIGDWLMALPTNGGDTDIDTNATVVLGAGGIGICNKGKISRVVLWSNVTSDSRLKSNIAPLSEIQYELFFDNLTPVHFNYNSVMPNGDTTEIHYGFIAQDIFQIENDIGINSSLVNTFMYKQEEYYNLNYDEFVALNTWQIQKAKARITELEEKVVTLETLVKSLTNS